MFTIPLQSLIEFLQEHCTVQSYQEFKDFHSKSIENSVDTALDMNDYDYLSVFSEDAEERFSDWKIVYCWPNEHNIVIKNNVPINIHFLCQIFLKFPHIPRHSFYKLIKENAEFQDLNPDSLYTMFDIWVDKHIDFKKLINPSKIGRNDPCPCGNGKKFKLCHGSHIKG